MNIAEKTFKKLFRKLGMELKWYSIYSSESLNLIRLLTHNHIDVVLDIGAYVGEYAMDLDANGFKGKIISFEPQVETYKKLKANNHKSKQNWLVADRMALGDRDGQIDLNVSGNSLSSSVLPMLEAHSRSAPDSIYIKKETVPIKRFDSIAGEFDLTGNLFIKIDVQGFEMDVLMGAGNTLRNTKGLQIELSLVDLYEGQTLMMDMINYLKGLDFQLHGFFPMFKDETSGRLLQADGVFFKE